MNPHTQYSHTLITSTPPESVQLIVQTADGGGMWHRVLNELHDLGIIAELSDTAYRVLGAFLRLNCARTGSLNSRTGLVEADIEKLRAVVRRGRSYVYKGRSELLMHPRSLLAERERDRYLVMPNWVWAGRAVAPPPPPDRPHPRIDLSAPADKSSAPADGTCAPFREARARQTNQPKNGRIDQNQSGENQGGKRCAEPVVGWPISNRGIRAMADGDVYGLLMALGVWDYMARPIAGCLHVSVERVLVMAREVACDPTAGNRGYCLGYRLAEAFGVKLPPSPAKGRITAQGVASGLEGVARLRIERMRKQSVQVQYEESDA